MAKIIHLNAEQASKKKPVNTCERFKSVLEKAKKGQLEPLTPAKLRKHPELQNISEKDAPAAIDTIKKLAAIFFEIAHHKEAICIDNQEVVNLNQENRAA